MTASEIVIVFKNTSLRTLSRSIEKSISSIGGFADHYAFLRSEENPATRVLGPNTANARPTSVLVVSVVPDTDPKSHRDQLPDAIRKTLAICDSLSVWRRRSRTESFLCVRGTAGPAFWETCGIELGHDAVSLCSDASLAVHFHCVSTYAPVTVYREWK